MPTTYTEAQRIAAFWARVQIAGPDECWLWNGGRSDKGYGQVKWAGRKQEGSHRVAFFLSGGYLPEGLSVCHTCDNPPCCNPTHLFAGTQQINVADCVGKGRNARGEKARHSKLKESEILAMRKAHRKGAKYAELAKQYGVSRATARQAIIGGTWKHLPL
jgi:hypothetical protein